MQESTLNKNAKELINQQKKHWDLVKQNYNNLDDVCIKSFEFGTFKIKVQFNPQRIVSSAAKVDIKSIQERPCFLCEKNRPEEQIGIIWKNKYELLVNPFPIFPVHYTIPSLSHEDQKLDEHIADMLTLSQELDNMVIFYNGPKCGASAPDHFHFQAGNIDFLPISEDGLDNSQLIKISNETSIYQNSDQLRRYITLKGNNLNSIYQEFKRIVYFLRKDISETEPMFNVICFFKNNNWTIHIFPRQLHRPSCYFKENDSRILISPASVDMGGVLVTPRLEDFEKITKSDIIEIYKEVCLSDENWDQLITKISEPLIKVGLLNSSQINFEYESKKHSVIYENGIITLRKENELIEKGEELFFYPESMGFILIKDVVIGVDFHWEQKENQKFNGFFQFIIENKGVTVVNHISIEDYLVSVISSEMSASSSKELLKAHAITSRSWLLAQLEKNKYLKEFREKYNSKIQIGNELIKWHDREDHSSFDVCADDHCQRYQGITRANTPHVVQAILETSGQVICSGDKICDARFYKCCGGITELFENCWEPENHTYLQNIVDFKKKGNKSINGDISKEEDFKDWILNHTSSFCNTKEEKIITQVLNEYDQKTPDFYRWEVILKQDEIKNLIPQRIGLDFGNIIDLIPLKRGPSGRIIRLKIVGTRQTLIIGKELIIRKALSKSHLYSSAFFIEKGVLKDGFPSHFTLKGAGWGHGVGLCQIGAAVMGEKGFMHEEILLHYFPNVTIEKNYGSNIIK